MNLVTFGCSYTQGIGLEDVYPETSKISKLAWPQKLADLIGCTVTNLGWGGSSNKKILHNILKHDYNTNDVVVVCWTHIDRWCIIKEDEISDIGIWQWPDSRKYDGKTVEYDSETTKRSQVFFEHLHDENDMLLQMQKDIQLAKCWLDKRNIKNYHFSVSIDKYFKKNEKWFDVKLLNFDFMKLRDIFPAVDNSHPGRQAQETVAKNIIELTEGLSI